MDGSVAPIFWYLFWVALAVAMFAGLFIGGHKAHLRQMTALNILKTYAEKGSEPPATLVDLLIENGEAQRREKAVTDATTRAAQPTGWLGLLFMAGVAAGLAWWRIDADGPQWAIYLCVTGAVVMGVGAFGQLVATIVATIATRRK